MKTAEDVLTEVLIALDGGMSAGVSREPARVVIAAAQAEARAEGESAALERAAALVLEYDDSHSARIMADDIRALARWRGE